MRKSSNHLDVIVSLVFMVLLLAIGIEAVKRYDFYKIALVWPKSFCMFHKDPAGKGCQTPMKLDFKIFGLWPMYNSDMYKSGEMVRPWNVSGCTETIPLSEDLVDRRLLAPILHDMRKHWPHIVYDNYDPQNEYIWRYEWYAHGCCFGKPLDPIFFFGTALNFTLEYNVQEILNREKIHEGEEYPLSRYHDALDTELRLLYPNALNGGTFTIVEIRCMWDWTNIHNAYQVLYDVEVCFGNDHVIKACNMPYRHCDPDYNITFPYPSDVRTLI